MTSLIKRLEALTGPSREVDAEIATAIGWKSVPWEFSGKRGLTWYAPDLEVHYECPRFTGSIDAAMTLTPEIEKPHFPWLAVKSNNPNNPIGCRCEMWLDNVQNFRGRGATIAIAVCIAALRARGVK